MSRNLLLSMAVVVPLLAVGGLTGTRRNSPPPAAVPTASIDVYAMQTSIDVRTLPEQRISDLF
jgi:hypothetical protein